MSNAVTSTRNRAVWLSIGAALDKNPLRDLAAHARRVGALAAAAAEPAAAINFGGCVAPETAVPDGNHGDNFAKGVL